MATDITTLVAGLGTAGDITSVTLAGTSDRSRLRVDVLSQTNPAFFASGQVVPNAATGAWSITFTADDDFVAGDVACDDKLEVDIHWLDQTSSPSVWVQETGYPKEFELKCDTCSIAITSLVGIPASTGNGMQEVIVSGTALTCNTVDVTVLDDSGNPCTASASVVGTGWEAHLVEGAAGVGTRLKSFHCNEDHLVRAECASSRDCFDETTLAVTCAGDCVPFAGVHVTPPDGGQGWDDPAAGVLQCVTPGDYTLEVTSPPASEVDEYQWFSGQTPVGTGQTHTVTIAAGENVTYNVRVTSADGCVSTFPITFSCGGPVQPPPDDGKPPPEETPPEETPPDDDDEEEGESGNIGCAVLLWIGIASMFFGLVLLIIGCVLEHFEPTAGTVLLIIGGSLFAFGWLLFAVWLLLCAALTDCPAILAVRTLVMWLILVFAVVAAILALLAIGDSFLWPCAGIAAAASVNWGVVLVILDWIAEWRRCIIINDRRRVRAARRAASRRAAPRTATRAAARRAAPRPGIGTAAKRVTSAMGIRPCAGCRKRAETLDRLTSRLRPAN